MTVDDNTNEISSDASTSDQQQPALDTITCLDIAWSAVHRPFKFLPGVSPLEFAALFCPLARTFQQLKRQTQPNSTTTAAVPGAAVGPANNRPIAETPSNNPTQDEVVTMTRDDFREFILAVKAGFDGFPHLWQRFTQLAREFMLSHSDPPPPKPSPA